MDNVFYKDFGNDIQQEPKVNTEVSISKPSIYLSLDEVYLVSAALSVYCRELNDDIEKAQSLIQFENYCRDQQDKLKKVEKLYSKLDKFVRSANG